MKPAVSVNNLHVSYYGKEVLRNIHFSIEQKKLVGIIGPNGAGKSTLLQAMLNLISSDKGEINMYGKPVSKFRKKVAYVPQRSQIDWDFPIHVLDMVLIGTYPNIRLLKRPDRKDKQWAYQCLEKVGMEKFSHRQIGELSGGQQQRVFLARALAQKAELFFLDEPFAGIDISSEETIIRLLKDLRNHGKTVVVVHHDLSKAEDYFDELLLLNKELIHYGNVEKVLRPEIMLKAYERELSFLKEVGVKA